MLLTTSYYHLPGGRISVGRIKRNVIFSGLTVDIDSNNNGTGNLAEANNWTDPILKYDHQDGSDVIGGFVYRGTLIPELYGKYVFADQQGNRDTDPIPNIARLFYADLQTKEIFEFNLASFSDALPNRIYSVGEDANKELYVIGADGVYAIVPEPGTLCMAIIACFAVLVLRRPKTMRIISTR